MTQENKITSNIQLCRLQFGKIYFNFFVISLLQFYLLNEENTIFQFTPGLCFLSNNSYFLSTFRKIELELGLDLLWYNQ
jgi:hypothetical protein